MTSNNDNNAKPLGRQSAGRHRALTLALLAPLSPLLALSMFSGHEAVAILQKSFTMLEPRSPAKKPAFQRAHDAACSAVAQEAMTSCDRSKIRQVSNSASCTPRKRVNIATLPLKAQGGLPGLDRQCLADLYYSSESAFELGAGESTGIAAATNLPRHVGVDSSSEWVAAARKRSPDRLRLFFADISPTGSWGYPTIKPINAKMKLDCQISPLFLERDPFDACLVDGRFRVACVMACFLHAVQAGADVNRTRVLLHDFALREKVQNYGAVKTVASVERQLGKGLLALSKQSNATQAA